jgi:hemoglobin
MRRAVDTLELPADQHATLWDYLERSAYFMINTLDESPASLPVQQ